MSNIRGCEHKGETGSLCTRCWKYLRTAEEAASVLRLSTLRKDLRRATWRTLDKVMDFMGLFGWGWLIGGWLLGFGEPWGPQFWYGPFEQFRGSTAWDTRLATTPLEALLLFSALFAVPRGTMRLTRKWAQSEKPR